MLATGLKFSLCYKNIFLPKLKKQQQKKTQKQSGNGSFGMSFFFLKDNMLSFISTSPKAAVLEGK